MKFHWPYSGPMLCLAAEGGTSGKNSSTDQRQIQATTGGAGSPVVGGDGNINTGLSVTTQSGAVTMSDQGAIAGAFDFAKAVASEAGKIQANASAYQKDTVAANTEFLSGMAGLFASNSAGGVASASNKTLLYIVAGVLVLVGAIFYFRR